MEIKIEGKNKGIFRQAKVEKNFLQTTRTVRNIEETSSSWRKMIPEGSTKLEEE